MSQPVLGLLAGLTAVAAVASLRPAGSANLAAVQRLRSALRSTSGSANKQQQALYSPAYHLARFKRSVLRAVEQGKIPASKIKTLEDLAKLPTEIHEYAGFLDDNYSLHEDDPARDDKLVQQVFEQADAWIRNGGLNAGRSEPPQQSAQAAVTEQMLRLDPKDVPDELLVAVLLMGAVDGDPVKVARQTLDELGGNLQRVLRAQAFDARGLKPLSRARMVATRELVRRANLRGVLAGEGPVLDSPSKVYEVARALSTGARERLTAIYLDSSNRVMGTREVSVGSHRYTLADPVQVFRPAVEMSARSVILIHNHPSGNATRSSEDEKVTRTMVDAGKVLQLPLLDHVIVTPTDQFSFREYGLI